MAERMPLWGVGPRLFLFTLGYAAVPVILTSCYPQAFEITFIPASVFRFFGLILVAIGIPFWAVSGRTIVRCFKQGVLCTKGVYSLVRHPIYSAVIVFVVPGILMFFRSWMLFTIPVAACLIFKRLIRREEDYLAERFGEEYLKYKASVRAILPIPRL